MAIQHGFIHFIHASSQGRHHIYSRLNINVTRSKASLSILLKKKKKKTYQGIIQLLFYILVNTFDIKRNASAKVISILWVTEVFRKRYFILVWVFTLEVMGCNTAFIRVVFFGWVPSTSTARHIDLVLHVPLNILFHPFFLFLELFC